MVDVIPFGTFYKLWTTGWGYTLLVFFSVFSLHLGRFGTFSFFCKAKLRFEMFTHEIFNQKVRVHGNYPSIKQIYFIFNDTRVVY